MGLAAFLGSAFWIGLIVSGLWPGTSYGFAGDPVYGDQLPPQFAGVSRSTRTSVRPPRRSWPLRPGSC